MTKCPYVPPHEFDLDFPHLMLRYRAIEQKQGKVARADRQLAETDRNGKLAGPGRRCRQLGDRRGNSTVAPMLRAAAGLHRDAALPAYAGQDAGATRRRQTPGANADAPAFGRKAVLYATCFGNYNAPDVGAGRARRAGAQRRRDRGGLSRLLRHAAARAGPHRRRRRQGAQGCGRR